MQRLFTTFLAVFWLAAAAGWLEAGATAIESTPIDDIIRLDGIATEWEGIPITYLRESLHVISVAHDDETLYLMFSFSDQRLAQQLQRRGVMLWFNGNGKTKNKNEEFGLRYGGSQQIADHFASQREDEGDDGGGTTTGRGGYGGRGSGPPPQMTGGSRAYPGNLTIVTQGIKETVPEDNSDGPAAASMVEEEIFCYELRVPLADVGGKIADRGPGSKSKVAIGIQIGGLTEAEMETIQPPMDERPAGMGGSTGGMGGGRGGGGMGGGRGGRGGPPGGKGTGELDPEIVWLSVALGPTGKGL